MKLFGLLFMISVGARSSEVEPRKDVKNYSNELPKLDCRVGSSCTMVELARPTLGLLRTAPGLNAPAVGRCVPV